MYAANTTVALARRFDVETVIKRDGRSDRFDEVKIVRAVERCFVNSLRLPEQSARAIAEQVARAVRNILVQRTEPATVEDVQRLVIQQLWALEHFEAAEQYTLYRESRRKVRLRRPISPERAQQVQEDQRHFATDLQYYQFVSKFSRWREADQRRETWKEACFDRVLPWLFQQPLVRGKLTEQEMHELGQAMYNLEAHPAMRGLQMAGPALDRCNVGLFNCAFQPITDLFSFPEMLYVLMQGTGRLFLRILLYVRTAAH